MATKSFSKSEAISYGWKTAKANLRFFVILLLILFAVQFLPGILRTNLKNAVLLSFLMTVCFWILRWVTDLGQVKIALEINDRKKARLADLFSEAHMIINYFLASLLFGAIVLAGLILLIVPGIIWAIKFQYFVYFIVDKELTPIEALKASSRITKGVKWNLFLLGLELVAINILGFLALGVGLFLSIPTSMIAKAHVFRKLSAKK